LFLCLTKHHAIKAYGGGGIVPHIFFNLGTGRRWEVSLTLWPLYPPGKELLVPIEQEAEWGPELVCTQWRWEKFPALTRNWTPESQSSSP
jgi:hypothetical protein